MQHEERVELADAVGLEILPAEREYPLIVHQRLSEVMAAELFGVLDAGTLSAIGCHTTLKANASELDKAVFVADTITWDQAGEPPYLEDILKALEQSLDDAAYCYLAYLQKMSSLLPNIKCKLNPQDWAFLENDCTDRTFLHTCGWWIIIRLFVNKYLILM